MNILSCSVGPRFVAALCCSVGLGVASVAHAQTLLSHYILDGSGDDTGSLNIDGTLTGTGAWGASGTGVGGFDRALSVGSAAGYLGAATANNSAFGLSAITITLWVKIDAASTTQVDRLVSNLNSSSGFDFAINNYTAGTGAWGADSFRLTFGFNSTSGAVQSTSASYVSDKWLFVAVTYDSAAGGNNVAFYSGDENAAVALASTAAKSGSIVASSSELRIGSTPATTQDRTPIALFNDVRIYNGALNAAQLETVRASALSTVPEPSAFAMLAGAAALGGVVMARRRRAG